METIINFDDLSGGLIDLDQKLGLWFKAIDARWESLKREYIEKSGNPLGFLPHIVEMSVQARSETGSDPAKDAYLVLDEIAEAFFKLGETDHDKLSEFFCDCKNVIRIHLGYIQNAAERPRLEKDAAVLRNALAIAALGHGGKDWRDLHVTLTVLASNAKKVGIDAKTKFENVSIFAGDKAGPFGINSSIKDFLKRFPV